MTKSDLKVGMTVETRNRGFYRLLKNNYNYIFCSLKGDGFNQLLLYDDELKIKYSTGFDDYDIMKIYAKEPYGYWLSTKVTQPCIWERKEGLVTYNINFNINTTNDCDINEITEKIVNQLQKQIK